MLSEFVVKRIHSMFMISMRTPQISEMYNRFSGVSNASISMSDNACETCTMYMIVICSLS